MLFHDRIKHAAGSDVSRLSTAIAVFLLLHTQHTSSSQVTVDIYYPDSKTALNTSLSSVLFTLGYSASPYSQLLSTQGQVPWFGNESYTISNETDRIGPDHWRTTINLGDFEGILYIEATSSFLFPSLIVCVDVAWTGFPCLPRHSPYSVTVETTASDVSLVMYPAYDCVKKGEVRVLLKDFYSPAFNNTRDINVYLPAQYLENPTKRRMNILVVLDGDLALTSLLADQGGLDTSVLNGELPEMIVIGVPPGLTGSACPSPDVCNQRMFEYTHTVCDPSAQSSGSCEGSLPSGGGNMTLDLIWDEVIPAVLAELQLERGEVSINGFSFGGLMACYAAGTRPLQFARAFCTSPSVWWNAGDLAGIVKDSYAASGNKPQAVTISVGTQEGETYINDVTPTSPWTDYIDDTVEAFKSIGLGFNEEENTMNDNSGAEFKMLSNLAYFKYRGAPHTMVNWMDVLTYGLPLLYAVQYPEPYRGQRNSNMDVVYPENTDADADNNNSDCDDNNDSISDGAVTGLIIYVVISAVVIGGMGMFIIYREKSQHRQQSKKNKQMMSGVDPDLSSPLI